MEMLLKLELLTNPVSDKKKEREDVSTVNGEFITCWKSIEEQVITNVSHYCPPTVACKGMESLISFCLLSHLMHEHVHCIVVLLQLARLKCNSILIIILNTIIVYLLF